MDNKLLLENNVSGEHESDLPLSSNFHDVKVQHFVLDLLCSVENQVFDCVITLFCKLSRDAVSVDSKNKATNIAFTPEQVNINNSATETQNTRFSESFCICLDCFAIDIIACNLYTITDKCTLFKKTEHSESSLKSLQIQQSYMNYYQHIYKCLKSNTQSSVSLDFIVSEHCLKVYLPHNIDSKDFLVLKICYRTRPEGPSLMWTTDQCGRPCVFTIGHMLNNRSLFPCQDLPQAMATWHCSVTLTDPHVYQMSVVMTGETEPEIFINENGEKVFNFYSSYPMPASTFALAVGTWLVTEISNPSNLSSLDPERFTMPRCCLFSPECLHEQSVWQLNKYLPPCFEALNSVLGPYPLKHLDILFVPECFDSLGLACPHLMFLSQSLLSPDLSMFCRLSHELCHTWFGILTGPRDWTEEWLTEGVCCYLEDIVHAAVMKWGKSETQDRSALRALLKFRNLVSEVSNTPEELQTLRPNVGSSGEINDQQLFVRNGLNHEKSVMQVHYLKGFFLLKYLEGIAGTEVFLKALRSFTSEHLGQLFSSKELLDYLFESCSKLSTTGLTVSRICQEWLDSPGIPHELNSFPTTVKNCLVTEIENKVSFIRVTSSRKRVRGQSSTSLTDGVEVRQCVKLLPEQLVLLLDMLVEDGVALTAAQLKTLKETHNIEEANAEVKHSWCELVIHRKAIQWIHDVESFLTHHQALGVYLYGELLISQNKRLQRLAYDCYNRLQTSMPEGHKTIVRAMLYPS